MRDQITLRSVYHVHLRGGGVARLSLTYAEASELVRSWVSAQGDDEINTYSELILQGVRLTAIDAIVKGDI